ncbi:Vacuolar protein sorting-associated protein 29 [Entophlyctis luteolus]|nr:Vacuolar protein sorting-associated protein 29 [Entophlyctis luteolus]KAJ3350856.1 Vacuolar protein sorting-associated protein 29 [Entophlyctis luteolus]KAJ3390289.1 Vacuolar protein sorting-associated protein 29 [Entophlyctis sp. JEL0112]
MVLVLVLGDLHIPTRAAALPAKFKRLLVPGKMQRAILTGNAGSKEMFEYVKSLAETTAVMGDWEDPAITVDGNPLPLSTTLQVGSVRIGVVHGHTVIPWGDRLALSAVARELDCDLLISGHTHAFEAFEAEGRFFLNPGSATGAFCSFRPLVRVPVVSDTPADKESPVQSGKTVEVNSGDSNRGDAETPDVRESEAEDGLSSTNDAADAAAATATESKAEPSRRTHKLVSDIIPCFALLDIQGHAVVVYVYKLIDGDVKVEKLNFTKKT